MHGENLRAQLQRRMNVFTDTLVDELVQIYQDALDQIVYAPLRGLSPRKPIYQAAQRAVLRPARDGGYEMALPDGRVWHGTRARDLRRKARQKGVAWQEQGI